MSPMRSPRRPSPRHHRRRRLAKGAREAGLAFAEQFNLVREGWNGFNVLHMAAARAWAG
jgi:hypothetical protein